jgi:hypothetical protein
MQTATAHARFDGLVVFGTPAEAERNAVRALEYRTPDPKAKLMLCSFATHQYFQKPLTVKSVRNQTCLRGAELSQTFRSLLRLGLIRLMSGQLYLDIP